MISDRLYELAFAYKKTRLWDKMLDSFLFGVELSNGQIGYLSVIGMGGEYYCALALFIGSEGLDCLRRMQRVNTVSMPHYMRRELMMQQDCLQCIFENRDGLSAREREDVKRYAREHGIKIAGKNAYPQFLRFTPFYYPWCPQEKEEQELLCEALEAAIEFHRILEKSSVVELGLCEMGGEKGEIPLLVPTREGYRLSRLQLPREKLQELPEPKVDNDISIAKLKRMKKKGVWECGIIRYPEPIQNSPEEVPHFPVVLLAVESEAQYILPVSPVEQYEEKPEELLNYFIEALLEHKICPAEIRAQDERVWKFAQDLGRKLGIPVDIAEDVPLVEELEEELLKRSNRGRGEDYIEEAEDMPFGPGGVFDGMDDELDKMDGELDRVENALGILGALLELDEKKLDELTEKLDVLTARLERDEAISPAEAEGVLKVLPGGLGKRLEGLLRSVASSEEARPDQILDFPGGGRKTKRRTERGQSRAQEGAREGSQPGKDAQEGPRPVSRARKGAQERSFVISVSLWPGCYRHIQIGGGSTLSALHGAILDAFSFDDDHAHAFFMDNVKWSDEDSYYAEGVEEDSPTTSDYVLDQVGLFKGKQFKYIFDFGDEWTFQCKVLRIVEGGTPVPVVVRSKGEAPEQYGYDEGEEEDDDE